jgi:nucleoside-diphosphate-sugar epimerase
MKFFVTGATGYIGSAVSEGLQKAGHQVLGLARSQKSADELAARRIEVQRGELMDKNSLRAAAQRADGVIHAASPSDGTSMEADNTMLDAILPALAGSNKPFLYTSGIWVIGDTGGRVVDEEEPLHAIPLVAWRVACEQRVLAAARDAIRAVVIRPGVVYGRGGGIPASLVQSGKENGEVIFVGDGENHWPMVWLDDIADLYLRALEKAPAGSIFHGAEKDSVTVREIAEAASEAAGVPGKITPWPVEEARKQLGGFADALALDQQISSEKARTVLGWTPKSKGVLEDLRRGSYVAPGASKARA